MKRTLSLRMRLTVIILLPLMTVALLAALWQLNNAKRTATDVFDRSLLSAALAVANDVTISGGDALSMRTRDLLASTSGGLVYYHVYAPDGVIVAGYATPPVGIPQIQAEASGPTFFNAVYLGQDVSGVRLQNRTEIDGFSGVFTTTVWQLSEVRSAFVRDLIVRTLIIITALIASLALIVWFGVRVGLAPLLDLEQAIERRSSDELTPIQRAVPQEVEGIVQTLNTLFAQLAHSMSAQSEFIANAAHQLRNPIAGVLALAEAVKSAPTATAAKQRAADLLDAARETADLSQKLLLLERAEAISPPSAHEVFSLRDALATWIEGFQASAPERVHIDLETEDNLGEISGDPTMLREAVLNLMTNACLHGGADMTQITVAARRDADAVVVSVRDNGQGIAAQDLPVALERFAQLSPTSVSGLGLSIVQAVAKSHGGSFAISSAAKGVLAQIRLPLKTS